jgi:hypothetical protein
MEDKMMMLKKMKKRSVVQLAALLLVAAFAFAVGACDNNDPQVGALDKRALLTKIAEAESAKLGVVVDPDGTTVNPSLFWVTQTVMDTFDEAIGEAGQVTISATIQFQVDLAVTTLTDAITAFNAAKAAGTSPIDDRALVAKIAEANAAKLGVEVDVAPGASVSPNSKWVIQTVMDTFNTAISAAETVRTTAIIQTEADAAVSTLNLAITAFNAAKVAGTKPSADYSSTLTWGTEFTPPTLGLTPGNDTTEIMLNWYSSGAVTDKVAKVRFIEGTKAAGYEVKEVTGAVAAAGSSTSHKAKVTGLKPGVSYQYSVCTDDTNWSPMYDFKVPAATGAFKFAVIADPQLHATTWDALNRYDPAGGKTTSAGWTETMTKIVAADVSFIASGGDQVDAGGGNEAEYTLFFAPAGLRSLPLAPVSGNHDAHDNFMWHYNLPNEQELTGAQSAIQKMGNYFYLYNNILFVVLNTAPYPTNTASAAPYIAFFRQTLQAATMANVGKYDWLIVQHHKSTASVADHLADKDIQYYVEAGFETLMSEFNVDFVLAGHDHVYARSYPLRGMAGGQVSVPDRTKTATSGSIWTGVQDPVYLTFTTGSGLKYYAVSSDTTSVYNNTLYEKENLVYPYLGEIKVEGGQNKSTLFGSSAYLAGALPVSNAAFVQPYIPSYCIVEVNGRTIKFSTYAIATVSGKVEGATDSYSFDAGVPYDVITVTK